MITYTTASTGKDLLQILGLQQSNLAIKLSPEILRSQGFVTVQHSFEDLQKMNNFEQSVIAKDGEKVIAYFLAMTEKSRFYIPVLVPMFELFDTIFFGDKKISALTYIVVGQVCIADGYRGQGIFDGCYAFYKKHFKHKYDYAITEIATRNLRSINAHKRVGFKTIKQYTAENDENWDIVLWDWSK